MAAKPFYGYASKQQTKQAKQVLKTQEKARKAQLKAENYRTDSLVREAEAQNKRTRRQSALESSNPFKRAFAQQEQVIQAKHEQHLRDIEAKTKTKELRPELEAKQRITEMRTKAQVAKAKAQAKAKFAGYSAIGVGASTLGRGLSDEGNQDDEKNRKHEQDIINTITGNDNDSGLKEGVM